MSGWCLGVSGLRLDGVWMVCQGVCDVSILNAFVKCYESHETQILPFLPVPYIFTYNWGCLGCVYKTLSKGVWMVSGICLRTEEV